MKASPLFFILCLGIAPAQAGSSFGGPMPASGAGHGHSGGAHHVLRNFVVPVLDTGPGPGLPALDDAPPPAADTVEAPRFAPPPPMVQPAYPPPLYVEDGAPIRRLRPPPHIIYLREPSRRRAAPVVIYGAG